MTTPAPAVAPYVPTYANRAPYLTTAEYKASPIGVDVSQLVVGGNAAANDAALQRQIARASGWADGFCDQVLAATTDTEASRFLVQADGSVKVPCAFSPVVLVTDVRWGLKPSTLAALTDLSDVWPEGKVVTIPLSAAARGTEPIVQVTYVNGWANTTLTATVTPGASTVQVANPVGILPGLTMRLDDGQAPIPVTVDASYVIGSTNVVLTAPLTRNYGTGSSLSAMPEAIKQAVVFATNAYIKKRGGNAVTLQGTGGTNAKIGPTKKSPDNTQDMLTAAQDLLQPFKRVV